MLTINTTGTNSAVTFDSTVTSDYVEVATSGANSAITFNQDIQTKVDVNLYTTSGNITTHGPVNLIGGYDWYGSYNGENESHFIVNTNGNYTATGPLNLPQDPTLGDNEFTVNANDATIFHNGFLNQNLSFNEVNLTSRANNTPITLGNNFTATNSLYLTTQGANSGIDVLSQSVTSSILAATSGINSAIHFHSNVQANYGAVSATTTSDNSGIIFDGIVQAQSSLTTTTIGNNSAIAFGGNVEAKFYGLTATTAGNNSGIAFDGNINVTNNAFVGSGTNSLSYLLTTISTQGNNSSIQVSGATSTVGTIQDYAGFYNWLVNTNSTSVNNITAGMQFSTAGNNSNIRLNGPASTSVVLNPTIGDYDARQNTVSITNNLSYVYQATTSGANSSITMLQAPSTPTFTIAPTTHNGNSSYTVTINTNQLAAINSAATTGNASNVILNNAITPSQLAATATGTASRVIYLPLSEILNPNAITNNQTTAVNIKASTPFIWVTSQAQAPNLSLLSKTSQTSSLLTSLVKNQMGLLDINQISHTTLNIQYVPSQPGSGEFPTIYITPHKNALQAGLVTNSDEKIAMAPSI